MIQNFKEEGVAAAPSAKSPKSIPEVIGSLGRGRKRKCVGDNYRKRKIKTESISKLSNFNFQ